jgi:hypothetical protein
LASVGGVGTFWFRDSRSAAGLAIDPAVSLRNGGVVLPIPTTANTLKDV